MTSVSTALDPFDFNGNPIRVVMIDGEPWFSAADVCRVLELEVHVALRRLDENEYQQVDPTRFSAPGGPARNVINESGLYSLVLGSRKSEARAFKRWITSEVLPAIRKTGSYTARPASSLDAIQAMVDTLRAQEARLSVVSQRTEEVAERAEVTAEQAEDTAARVAAIEGRHDWFSALAYARLHSLPTSHTWLNRLGVTAGRIGRSHGMQPHKTQHSLFGEVNMWPEWVWAAAHAARKITGEDA